MTAAARVNGALRGVPPAAIYLLGALPALWLVTRGLTGGLGPDPVKALEHALGLHALQFLIAGLCITPLRRLTGVSLLRYRRALGLLGFAYVLLHFAVWLGLDLQLRWSEIGRDIVKRPYVTIGMLGLVLLLPLAATSSDSALRRMGAVAWRRLHLLTYPAVLAGALHYVMLVKAWPREPLVYLGLVLALLAIRVVWWSRRRFGRPQGA